MLKGMKYTTTILTMGKIILDIETTGLNAMADRVLCICTKNPRTNETKTYIGEDERRILNNFWEDMESVKTLVGYGSDGFDIPFLVKRSIILGVPVSQNYQKMSRIDLRKVVNSFFVSYNKYEKGKLEDWAEVMEMKVETPNGSHMPEYYEHKNWKAIEQHCIEDVEITTKLFNRCKQLNVL